MNRSTTNKIQNSLTTTTGTGIMAVPMNHKSFFKYTWTGNHEEDERNFLNMQENYLQIQYQLREYEDKYKYMSAHLARTEEVAKRAIVTSDASIRGRSVQRILDIERENQKLDEEKMIMFHKLEKERKMNMSSKKAIEKLKLKNEKLNQEKNKIMKLMNETKYEQSNIKSITKLKEIKNKNNIEEEMKMAKMSLANYKQRINEKEEKLNKENEILKKEIEDINIKFKNEQKLRYNLESEISKLNMKSLVINELEERLKKEKEEKSKIKEKLEENNKELKNKIEETKNEMKEVIQEKDNEIYKLNVKHQSEIDKLQVYEKMHGTMQSIMNPIFSTSKNEELIEELKTELKEIKEICQIDKETISKLKEALSIKNSLIVSENKKEFEDDNIFELYIFEAIIEKYDVNNEISSFVTVNFFEHESQATEIIIGNKPFYNMRIKYKIKIDDFFLKYLEMENMEFDLNIPKTCNSENIAKAKFNLFKIIEDIKNGINLRQNYKFYKLDMIDKDGDKIGYIRIGYCFQNEIRNDIKQNLIDTVTSETNKDDKDVSVLNEDSNQIKEEEEEGISLFIDDSYLNITENSDLSGNDTPVRCITPELEIEENNSLAITNEKSNISIKNNDVCFNLENGKEVDLKTHIKIEVISLMLSNNAINCPEIKDIVIVQSFLDEYCSVKEQTSKICQKSKDEIFINHNVAYNITLNEEIKNKLKIMLKNEKDCRMYLGIVSQLHSKSLIDPNHKKMFESGGEMLYMDVGMCEVDLLQLMKTNKKLKYANLDVDASDKFKKLTQSKHVGWLKVNVDACEALRHILS